MRNDKILSHELMQLKRLMVWTNRTKMYGEFSALHLRLLTAKQEDHLKTWVGVALPRSMRHAGAWIEKEFGLVYESRSGLIALLHRLGLEYHKPDAIPQARRREATGSSRAKIIS